jgi:hypothetical protein
MCTVGVERGRDRLLGDALTAVVTVVTASLNQIGTAEDFYVVILRAVVVLLIASWTDLL